MAIDVTIDLQGWDRLYDRYYKSDNGSLPTFIILHIAPTAVKVHKFPPVVLHFENDADAVAFVIAWR